MSEKSLRRSKSSRRTVVGGSGEGFCEVTLKKKIVVVAVLRVRMYHFRALIPSLVAQCSAQESFRGGARVTYLRSVRKWEI